MNNCDNTDGGSSSNTQALPTPTTTTIVSSTTTTSSASVDKRDIFYTSNGNLLNNSKVEQENDTKCAGITSNINETAAVADRACSIVSAAAVTVNAVSTVSYAAITAMDTATATAFISSCTHHQQEQQQQFSGNKFEIENSIATVSAVSSDMSNCDKTTTTSEIVTSTISSTTPTTICDNELIIKQPSTTTPIPLTPPLPPRTPSPTREAPIPTPTTTSITSESPEAITDATPESGEGSGDEIHHEGVEETVATASSLSIENLENKEKMLENISSTTTTRTTMAAVSSATAESLVVSVTSGSVGSNCGDIVANSSKIHSGDNTSNKSPMLLRKKISTTLTTTSSEPILRQCGSGSSSGHKAESSTSSGLTTTSTALSGSVVISRRVSFPKSDEALVTGYLEPANPWEHVHAVNSISEISELYVQSCHKHNTIPIQLVLDHLKKIELNKANRQPSLSLKSIKLLPSDCEALEEIFKRVQYKSIDISSCELNETAAIALFDMFEYYEATNELDISSNADGMTSRGWTSCVYMVSRSRELQVLNAQGNPLSKSTADNLGSALNSSNLHTIKLEHCGLRGHPLDSLCLKLRNNRILRELWLAHNDLTCLDADKIAQLLRVNHYLQLIDISNNNIKDEGLASIVKALIEQSADLERMQIAAAKAAATFFAAVAEAEHKKRQQQQQQSSNSTNSATSSIASIASNGTGTSTDDDTTSGDSDASPAEEEEEDDDDVDDDDEADDADVDTDANDVEDDDATTTDDCGILKAEEDDDDEDTVKTTTMKTTPPINGQSKLDKLLSMNNSDSSEDAPTDTVAASDISVSDDIFDSTNVVPVVASTPIVEPAIEQPERPAQNNNNNTAEAALFEISDMIEGTVSEAATIVTTAKALDVNKNATKLDDFDDTHSTDSAFESSSDGDISRHLPEEFGSRCDSKEEVETATIATEALSTPTPTPPPALDMPPQSAPPTTPQPIEVTSSHSLGSLAASASPNTSCDSSSGGDMSALKNAALTGTSPSPASGMRRTESTATITQTTRVRSHSCDSLSSDNSLDGSISDAGSGNFSTKINEKLTKNDTLTRQKQFDVPQDSNKTPHGLKALALWNNNLTKESGPLIADLIATTVSLELLNIGKNILCNDFVAAIRDSLSQNKTVTTLGLQSAHLSSAGIRTLSSIVQFGGNSTLQRIDIRDNKIEVESLNMLAEALKSNTTVTQIDIDDEPKRLSIGSDAQLDYARVLENVRSLCARNENQPSQPATADKTTTVPPTKRRGGYYLGSRKISLTCHTVPPRAIIDQASNNTTPTSSKLEVKKKTGVRLRSPIPSPPTISPSSSPVPSPSKSRFQVFRVSEDSPLTSPMSPSSSPSPSPSPTPICTAKDVSGVFINSKDSTTTIKRLSTSPRSRFQVMKIYEDPGVPIAHRTLPPITPSPSPPTAPSITTPPPLKTSPPRAFEEPKIVTTPATPPIEEEKNAEAPSFAATTPANATTIVTTTDTKTTNPNPLIVNDSTNNVKPNDQVDASVPIPLAPQEKVEPEEDEKLKCLLSPQLPMPAVEEDQRTLTNSSVNSCLIDSITVTNTTTSSSAQSAAPEFTTQTTSSSATQESQEPPPETQEPQEAHDPQEQQELQQQPAAARVRKASWIQNSAYPGVDRLLSMFQNPGQIFQRSSSPETTLFSARQEERPSPFEADQQSLVPVRKRSPPSTVQFPWCKLGTEICKPVTTAIQTAASVSSGYTATGGPTTAVVPSSVEVPQSFFDVASKQIRDFSKQVFRQNIPINIGTLNPESSQLHHDCDTIPNDVKLEIKENISPEHTINEEQLQTLQKIGGSPGSSSTSSSGTDTTEGASISTSTTSSPSPLLNAPLIGVASTPSEVLGAAAVAAAQSHVTTEEQPCTS